MGIDAELQPEAVAIAPGERGTWTVAVRNTGTEPVPCRLVPSGEVAAWAWVTPAEVVVEPGGSAEAHLSVRLPPPPSPPAGRLAFTVGVEPAGAIARGVVDVQPVVDVSTSVSATAVTVRNRGNAEAVVALSPVPGGGRVRVEPPTLVVAPGEIGTAHVTARGRFSLNVVPQGGAATVVHGGAEPVARRGDARRRWPVVVPVAAVVLVVAGVLVTRDGDGGSEDPDLVGVEFQDPTQGLSSDCPMVNHLAADANGVRRRGVPIPDRYSFLEPRPGGCHPVRFNPCEPIHYVVNSRLAPPGALDDLEPAFAQLSAATGMTFVNDGPTDEPATPSRPPYIPARYGQRWAPILIVWDHGAPFRMEDTNPGGGRAFNGGGVYVSGILILNVDAVTDARRGTKLPFGFGPGATWGRVMIHELGHLVGLGHVRTSQEIMFDDLGLQRGRAEFHEGDLEGLRLLGREQGCLPTPPVPAVPPRTPPRP
jgi:hypothetical protein